MACFDSTNRRERFSWNGFPELSMKRLLLNGQKVTTVAEVIGLDSVRGYQ